MATGSIHSAASRPSQYWSRVVPSITERVMKQVDAACDELINPKGYVPSARHIAGMVVASTVISALAAGATIAIAHVLQGVPPHDAAEFFKACCLCGPIAGFVGAYATHGLALAAQRSLRSAEAKHWPVERAR